MSDSVWPHRRQPTRLPHPWDSPGKNTTVGCHFLLQCMKVKMKVKSLSRVWLLATPGTEAYQAPPTMGFSRQEYGSGVPLEMSAIKGAGKCGFLFWVAVCACILSLLQSCRTLCDPMDCNLPGSSVHGILQARILEWVAISFSRGSSQPRDRTCISCIAGRFFTIWATREAPEWQYS